MTRGVSSIVAEVLPVAHDCQANPASDHASHPAMTIPATVATKSSQWATRGDTLCESSITRTCPPVRSVNAAARKIETARKYALYSHAKERLTLRTVRQKISVRMRAAIPTTSTAAT